MKKISIIIVTYNAANYLQTCLSSIENLVLPDIDVIIVDGASTDGTVDIIRNNTQVVKKWISEPDKGIYDAMNKGLKLTSGNWVYFLGADDTLLPEFSKMLMELVDSDTIYYGSVLARGGKYLGLLTPYAQAKIGICHQAMIYPKAVFEEYQFDLKYRISADHHLNMKLWSDKKFKIKFVDYIIANFNHSGISSTQKDWLFEKDKQALIFRYFGIKIGFRFLFRELKATISKKKYKA